jgi:hypothetical protein
MNLKTQWPLVLAFLLPIGLVAVLVGIIFLPRLWLKPQQSFLYSVSRSYYSTVNYSVRDGKLVSEANTGLDQYSKPDASEPQLYTYNPANKTSERLTADEAMRLKLNDNLTSRDGYRVNNEYSGGDFLFGRSKNQVVLTSKKGSLPVALEGVDSSDYNTRFTFIGWIE